MSRLNSPLIYAHYTVHINIVTLNIYALFKISLVHTTCIFQYILYTEHQTIIQQHKIHNCLQLYTCNCISNPTQRLFTRVAEIVCNDVLSATDITHCESIGLQSQTPPYEAWILYVACL